MALMVSVNRKLSALEVKNILLATTDPKPGLAGRCVSGVSGWRAGPTTCSAACRSRCCSLPAGSICLGSMHPVCEWAVWILVVCVCRGNSTLGALCTGQRDSATRRTEAADKD